jgi:hypothetical protein
MGAGRARDGGFYAQHMMLEEESHNLLEWNIRYDSRVIDRGKGAKEQRSLKIKDFISFGLPLSTPQFFFSFSFSFFFCPINFFPFSVCY